MVGGLCGRAPKPTEAVRRTTRTQHMTPENIQQWAREAGMPSAWLSDSGVLKWSDLQRFADLARADLEAENEAVRKANIDCVDHFNQIKQDYDALRAEVERLTKVDVELVMIYHGGCTIDCGEHGHHNMEMLKLIPTGTKLFPASALAALRAQLTEAQADAARYRWLREQHWSSSSMCVVDSPKTSVQLGSRCPSRELLDADIDDAMKKQQIKQTKMGIHNTLARQVFN